MWACCFSIENGVVVSAGSVVPHDAGPYKIVAGNPATKLRKRFTDEEIEALGKSKWFNYSPNELLQFYAYKDDPIEFSNAVIEVCARGNLCERII